MAPAGCGHGVLPLVRGRTRWDEGGHFTTSERGPSPPRDPYTQRTDHTRALPSTVFVLPSGSTAEPTLGHDVAHGHPLILSTLLLVALEGLHVFSQSHLQKNHNDKMTK